MSATLEKMKAMVRDHDTCVLATAAEGEPHCSLMAYLPDQSCRKVYMVTHRGTKKYRNLCRNPTISRFLGGSMPTT